MSIFNPFNYTTEEKYTNTVLVYDGEYLKSLATCTRDQKRRLRVLFRSLKAASNQISTHHLEELMWMWCACAWHQFLFQISCYLA